MSAELVAKYEEHLALVRNLAENSIRGYVSDLEPNLESLNSQNFKSLTFAPGLRTYNQPEFPGQHLRGESFQSVPSLIGRQAKAGFHQISVLI